MKRVNLRHFLALRCHEASEIASASLDRELTAGERWVLRLHAFVCQPCRRLIRQLRAMRQLMQSAPASLHASSAGAVARLSNERRRQMKQVLADADRSD